MSGSSPRVAFFTGFFGGGGIERVMANLAHGFVKQGVKVDLLHDRETSPHLWQMPAETRFIDYVNDPSLYKNLPRIVRYLKEEKPTALMTADHYANEVAIMARRIAGGATRLVVTEHNQLSRTSQNVKGVKARLAPFAAHFLYPWADKIVAVSQGVATDLAQTASLSLNRIQTIYNPVIPRRC